MDVWTFSLLAGHSCPGADKCMARVNLTTHLLEDGPKQEFRCFSATQEVAFSNTRKAHQHNFEKLRGCATTQEMVELLIRSLPKKAMTIRVHVSGDFFNQRYFDAWQAVAALRPSVLFYAYTKSIPFWAAHVAKQGKTSPNFRLTASIGGRYDAFILPWMVTALVVEHPSEARKLKLPIDHDDRYAQKATRNFALLLHGAQKPGTKQSRALKRMRQEGVSYGYAKA